MPSDGSRHPLCVTAAASSRSVEAPLARRSRQPLETVLNAPPRNLRYRAQTRAFVRLQIVFV